MEKELTEMAIRVGEVLRQKGLTMATAESCTGGWVAKLVTDVAGSSGWFDRGFITYTNQAKQDMLGVKEATLAAHGAVSEATVAEMAAGALRHSQADVAVAISGIAGPTGGSPDKPVGTVCLAWSRRGGPTHTLRLHFDGDREAVRAQAALAALTGIADGLGACRTQAESAAKAGQRPDFP
jgi:nicotinamide-nucleotide amidase